MKYETMSLTTVKHRKVTKQTEVNINKLSKRAILRHLVMRFLKDYQTDILTIAVFSELAYIVVKSI